MAEARDLKSLKCGFESHLGYFMRKKIAPKWVLMEILDLLHQGVDIHDWELVKEFLERQSRFTMLEWIKDNRSLFYYTVLSKQYDSIGTYYGDKQTGRRTLH
jgi:hypothetical protein